MKWQKSSAGISDSSPPLSWPFRSDALMLVLAHPCLTFHSHATGGLRVVHRGTVRRHEPLRHPREEGDDHASRHEAGPPDPGREGLLLNITPSIAILIHRNPCLILFVPLITRSTSPPNPTSQTANDVFRRIVWCHNRPEIVLIRNSLIFNTIPFCN